jgi:predicted branched-subunit amino acid permease
MPSFSSPRRQFLAGITAELPILLGGIPFGIVYGVVALAAGLTAWQAQAMSAIVFAGSAQFITAQLVGAGAPGLVIIITGTPYTALQ